MIVFLFQNMVVKMQI